eukprot:NODE_2084_length_2296_cov_6.189949.p1 GENE.NODE_2084_length_2296_cov_6.189949~~NODE_2084_length_2296_cov_6.189949.p1  ORF type:complete len:392 (+),score=150.61 NODE_2084_length_2296_cov_6.189949:997-2172(+)
MQKRDYVTGAMWTHNKPPYRLVLNTTASSTIMWHCKHYQGRGLMKHFATGAELAKDIGVDAAVLDQTFRDYTQQGMADKCPFGKAFSKLPLVQKSLPFELADSYYSAIITPVIHYCMGGLKNAVDASVLSGDKPIPGLFCAGEVAGGIHGLNRLGGSSLLDCVVFGRVSGASAAACLLTRRLSGGFVSGAPAAVTAAAPAAKAADAGAVAAGANVNKDEVAKHNTDKDCWVIVGGQVLNVTDFLKDHPGGKGAIMLFAGKDATEEFDMLHDRKVIKKYLKPAQIIGQLAASAKLAGAVGPAACAEDAAKTFNMQEVAKHNNDKDCWVVVGNQVLNVTNFLADHPGGKGAIMLFAGKDATDEFDMLHDRKVIKKYLKPGSQVLGTLATTSKL